MSLPAPPTKESPVVNVWAVAMSEAVKVSAALPPVKLSTPVVSVYEFATLDGSVVVSVTTTAAEVALPLARAKVKVPESP